LFKSLRFLGGTASGSRSDDLRARWDRTLATTSGPMRPERVALCLPVTTAGFPPSPFAAVDIQWFPNQDAALANEEWLASVDAELCIGAELLGAEAGRVVAEELTFWGEQYLHSRWQLGGERYKSISCANRNPSLTFAEFLPQWRAMAGIHGDERPPEPARGLAYVQNHPLEESSRAFDAVNEVWFASIDDLVARRDYFAGQGEDAMKRAPGIWSLTERWTMFARELPVT
jgi:hypothetical protein